MNKGRSPGRLPYESFQEIADREGIDASNVSAAFKRACRKLQEVPDAVEILAAAIRVNRWDHQVPMGCASVECNREYISLYAED